MARGRFGLDAARPDMVQATPQKVKPDNHSDIMGRISWLLARNKHSNSMDGTAWLFCIKKWSLITTVL